MFIKRFNKSWFQKKYVAFFTIVPLLVVGSLIQVDDPLSGGTGFLEASPGMENVRIINAVYGDADTSIDVCGSYILYKYDVAVTAANDSSEAVSGWIKIVLTDVTDVLKSKVLDDQYVIIDIPGNTTVEASYYVWFSSGLSAGEEETTTVKVDAVVMSGKIPSPTGNEFGKIPLNSWFFVNALKDSFKGLVQIEKPYAPPFIPFDLEG